MTDWIFAMRKSRRITAGGALGVIACCAGAPLPALAQAFDQYLPTFVPGYDTERDANIPARPRTEYDPIGIRLGDFTVLPELDETIGYDSNPLGGRPATGSWVVGTAPRIDFSNQRAGVNSSVVSLGGSVGLTNEQYLHLKRQNYTDWNASLGASYDIGKNPLTLSGSEIRQHEVSTDINSASATQPIGYDVTDARVRYETTQGFVRFQPNFDYTGYRFDNTLLPGDVLSQKARDRNIYSGGLTTHIGDIPERSLVVVLHADGSQYIGDLAGGPRPDSVAYEGLVGTNYAVSGNLKILMLVGYERRQFASSAFRTQSSPVVDGAIVWTPSGLTTLTVSGYRTIEDSIGESTTGVTESKVSLIIDHEYLRNILFQGRASLDHAAYGGGFGAQTLYQVGASATWKLNRNVQLVASYDYTSRNGDTAGESITNPFQTEFLKTSSAYNRNLAQLELRLVF